MPDYIKIFSSVWVLITCLIWCRGLLVSLKTKQVTFQRGVFSAGFLWFISGIAPVWVIAMIWRFL